MELAWGDADADAIAYYLERLFVNPVAPEFQSVISEQLASISFLLQTLSRFRQQILGSSSWCTSAVCLKLPSTSDHLAKELSGQSLSVSGPRMTFSLPLPLLGLPKGCFDRI